MEPTLSLTTPPEEISVKKPDKLFHREVDIRVYNTTTVFLNLGPMSV